MSVSTKQSMAQAVQPTLEDSETIHEVFIPADETGAANRDYVLVPQPLYQRMWRDLEQQQGPPRWILTQANYRGVMEPTPDRSGWQLTAITANLELRVPNVDGPVAIPLDAAAFAATKRDALLDGRTVALTWDAQRTALLVPIQQAGRHELQLGFQTMTLREAGLASVTLPIPATPQATLLLTAPQELQTLRVPSAQGAVQRREATSQLRAELGPTPLLRIEWPTATAADPAPAIDQLSWLRLNRDQVRLDVQLAVDANRYLDPTLIVEADERLQMDISRSMPYLSFAPAPEPGLRRFEFSVPQTAADREIIRLSFIVNGSTGIGRLRFPHFKVVDQPVAHSLGVSAAPGIVLRVEPGNGATLSANDFGGRWGGEDNPDYAYEFDEPLRGWNCQGRWSTPQCQVETELAYILNSRHTELVCLANIESSRRFSFRQQVELPADCRVDTVELLSSHPGNRLTWSQHDTMLTWIFDQPLQGSYQVGIVARQEAGESPRRLPQPRFTNATQTTGKVDLFRRQDVILPEYRGDTPEAPELTPFVRSTMGLARWQTRWQAPDDQIPWHRQTRA